VFGNVLCLSGVLTCSGMYCVGVVCKRVRDCIVFEWCVNIFRNVLFWSSVLMCSGMYCVRVVC
jgi:hypothetical protein